MTHALAGRGPDGTHDWDDDRTVLVMTMGDQSRATGQAAEAVH